MPEIEYFYSAHSAYAYLGSARLMDIASAANRQIVHKPIKLTRVIDTNALAPAYGRPKKFGAYFFGREIERWSQARNTPVMNGRPTHHDNDMTLANCMLIAGLVLGDNIDQLAHGMLEAHWRDDADLADRKTLVRIGEAADLDPLPLLLAAAAPEIAAIYEKNTVEAVERSVFGAPTYFVDGDMFYGQDRLELVERALAQPFSGTWPRS
jgi:2-hydroxychromene-2-carboxylate isomerase